MKVLYIGGTGEISYACVQRSVALGQQVTVLNRGQRDEALPAAVEQVVGDLRDDEIYAKLAAREFDVVCQFLVFDEPALERDLQIFSGRCGQYVFISSAAAYRKPHHEGLVTEDIPLDNPFWAYGRSKAACEALLLEAADRLPFTIVRPSHTYRTRLPSTVIDGNHLAWRLLQGKPVLVHDDGSNVWTLTHAEDFAVAFADLLAAPDALGGVFHITSDEAPSWRSIIESVAQVVDAQPDIRGVPTAMLIGYEPAWEGPLLGDKANAMRFDNSALRRVIGDWQCEVSLADGLERVWPLVAERLASGYAPNATLDALIDRIVAEAS